MLLASHECRSRLIIQLFSNYDGLSFHRSELHNSATVCRVESLQHCLTQWMGHLDSYRRHISSTEGPFQLPQLSAISDESVREAVNELVTLCLEVLLLLLLYKVLQHRIYRDSARIRNNERRMLMEYTQGLWVSWKTKKNDYKVVKFILEDMEVQSEQGQETNQVQGSDILIKCSQRSNFNFFLKR